MKNVLKASLAILMGAVLLTVTSRSKNDDDKKKLPAASAKQPRFAKKDFILSDYNISIDSSMFSLFLN